MHEPDDVLDFAFVERFDFVNQELAGRHACIIRTRLTPRGCYSTEVRNSTTTGIYASAKGPPMSESIIHESSVVRPHRGWLIAATTGVVMVTIALIVSTLVTFDKPHFGFLVGTWFLPIIASGVIAGSLLLLVAAIALPERKTWRGITLIVWALIALTSPLFGLMFLVPWALLAITLPIVVMILRALFRKSA